MCQCFMTVVLEKLEACREQLKNLQAQAGFTEEFQEIAEVCMCACVHVFRFLLCLCWLSSV